ncbi:uncharacterized protein LOC110854184 isoform X2 [Folsomia candida]|uniref:uncharacterized protein LOC110854184 isoform X2 n=2 Tax=Folsomia candida TaxID=158441 RepID=UPI001604AA62|nr:uncharacterized protein LOC110854184 isoform X2 [Folsomia candida]
MDMVHGSKTKKKIVHSRVSQVSVRTLTNPPTTKSASNAYCSVCRDIGTCSFCVQKNNTMELTNIEFSPSNKKEPELREIKVESPNSPVVGGDNNGFPPDVLSSTPMAGKSVVIDVENGTTKKKEAIKKDADRKWRYFPGKNRFFCNGRLIAAPNISFCLCCFLLIVVTFTLFIIFDGPYLADRWSLAVPILGIFMFLTVIVSMLKTTFSDPGIIPRASQQEAEYMERCYATNNVGRPPPRTKDVIVNGQTLKVKYCFTCKMFRPPRASHCGVCDNCVDRFDHHCPFLGNCIGKRNYRHFYAFVLSLSFLCVFVLSCATAHLVLVSKERGNFLDALKESPTSAIVVVISFFGMWTVLGLAGFHTYLISVEQTTNEDIKGLFGRSAIKNPFSRGNIFLNCSFVLCGPLQPSLIDPRGKVTDDFLLSLPRKNDATGVPTSSICNRSSLHIQTSMKTGPQCVEASNRSGVAKSQNQQQQQPTTFTSATTSQPQMHAQLNHQISTSGAPPPIAKQVADGITLTSHSPDSGSGLLYTSNSSNRSLSNMNSGSMRNLYNSIEEDPATTSADSGSESNLSQENHNTRVDSNPSNLLPSYQATPNDDYFDDPTILNSSQQSFSSSSTNQPFRYGYGFISADASGLDIDDPISAQGLRRIDLSTRSKRSRLGHDKNNGQRDDSAISLPSISNLSGNRKNKSSSSSVHSLKSQHQLSKDILARNRIGSSSANTSVNGKIPTNNNSSSSSSKKFQNQPSTSASINNNRVGGLTSSNKNQNGPSTSSDNGFNGNKSRISSRKLSKSTMIDSPLHLDPIT